MLFQLLTFNLGKEHQNKMLLKLLSRVIFHAKEIETATDDSWIYIDNSKECFLNWSNTMRRSFLYAKETKKSTKLCKLLYNLQQIHYMIKWWTYSQNLQKMIWLYKEGLIKAKYGAIFSIGLPYLLQLVMQLS